MQPNYKLYVIGLWLLSGIIGCKKFVELDPPATVVTSSNIYVSDATAAAAVTGIYTAMMQGSHLANGNAGLSLLAGLSADELKNYAAGNQTFSQFYTNNLNSVLGTTFWKDIYQYIYSANAAIEGLSRSQTLTASIKQQLTGEAKFLRAFMHFYAINLYGDAPLVTTTDYNMNNAIARSSKEQVYEQIIKDLKDAQDNLSEDFLDPGGHPTTERVRPNKGAATALLARVYLYTHDWANAEAQSTLVINNTASYGLIDMNDVFLANSMEAIWQLQPVDKTVNTWDGNIFILTTTPTNVAISQTLLDSFETGDNRKANWIGSITKDSNTYYYPYKYKVKMGSELTEYLMVLRLAEQYLIRAEARAQQGKISEAQDDLNAIRTRAGLSNTTASDQPSLLTAILHERQAELFTEWGHRWLDLKRTGTIDAVMSIITPLKGGTWNTDWQLYPILQSEIAINPNLTQNPGY